MDFSVKDPVSRKMFINNRASENQFFLVPYCLSYLADLYVSKCLKNDKTLCIKNNLNCQDPSSLMGLKYGPYSKEMKVEE